MTQAGVRTLHYHVLAASRTTARPLRRRSPTGSAGSQRPRHLAGRVGGAEVPRRRVDPADRRRKIVAITPAGQKQLESMDQLIYAAEADLLEPLSATERKTLLSLLNRLSGD